ncbi:MAG: hypothetical protein FD122_3738, partial [Stygiobacter sp.]
LSNEQAELLNAEHTYYFIRLRNGSLFFRIYRGFDFNYCNSRWANPKYCRCKQEQFNGMPACADYFG